MIYLNLIPISNKPISVLEGTFGKSTIGENIKSYTDGWVVNQWGTNSMGRWMLYKTINMDELPTSYTF